MATKVIKLSLGLVATSL